MSVAVSDATKTAPVMLLCPNCHKRLPLSGPFSMRGSLGVFCRNCRCTVPLSMEVIGADQMEEVTQDQ